MDSIEASNIVKAGGRLPTPKRTRLLARIQEILNGEDAFTLRIFTVEGEYIGVRVIAVGDDFVEGLWDEPEKGEHTVMFNLAHISTIFVEF
jgi:hypothetical protein